MKRVLTGVVILIAAFIAGCKKEPLSFDKIVHLESHTSSRLNNIRFVNGIGIIGGGEKYLSAEILISKDGGNTWTHSSYPEAGKGMYGLGTSPNGTVYLSGFDGKVLSSADFDNWTVNQVPDWRYYVALTFPTDETGILIATSAQQGGTVVRLRKDFTIIDTTTYQFGLNDVAFTNAATGYVAGYGAVLKTTDTGKTWTYTEVKNDNFKAIHCTDANDIWICGAEGSIFHSTNAGSSWARVRNGNLLTAEKWRLNDIVFRDAQTGWAVGEKGLVIYTDNGGKDWKKYRTVTDDAFLSIAIAPDGNLVVTGENGSLYKLYP